MDQLVSGLPVETIGIWGIYAFTLIMGGTLTLQIAEVFSKKSVAALSTTWIVYFAAMFLSGVIYGIDSRNTPLYINNLVLAATHILLVAGIIRYRGLSTRERWFTGSLLLALIIMILNQHKDRFFFAFAPVGVLAILKQAWTIHTERRTGVLSPWLLASYVLANIFWTMYALAGSDWTLHIISPTNLIACSVLFATWWRYRPAEVLAE